MWPTTPSLDRTVQTPSAVAASTKRRGAVSVAIIIIVGCAGATGGAIGPSSNVQGCSAAAAPAARGSRARKPRVARRVARRSRPRRALLVLPARDERARLPLRLQRRRLDVLLPVILIRDVAPALRAGPLQWHRGLLRRISSTSTGRRVRGRTVCRFSKRLPNRRIPPSAN